MYSPLFTLQVLFRPNITHNGLLVVIATKLTFLLSWILSRLYLNSNRVNAVQLLDPLDEWDWYKDTIDFHIVNKSPSAEIDPNAKQCYELLQTPWPTVLLTETPVGRCFN